MRKYLFLVVALTMAVCVNAQVQYKLVRFSDNYGYEMTEYVYDAQYRMIAEHEIYNGTESYDVYDSLSYDAQGNLVKLSGWQLLSGSYQNVYYIDYTYDAEGRVTSRTNYNYYQGEWCLGGVYEYSYDQNGFISLSTLTMGGDVFQKIEYTNDSDGVVEELWSYSSFGGGFEPSEKLVYVRENGRVKEVYDSTYDEGSWTAFAMHRYSYDEEGNCLRHAAFDATGSETERQVYTIDTKRVDECLIPWTPEMKDEARPRHLGDGENENVYTKEEYWTLDDNFVLQHFCDYTFEYIGINESGVEEVVSDRVSRKVKKVMVDGVLYIECEGVVYDVSGRKIR